MSLKIKQFKHFLQIILYDYKIKLLFKNWIENLSSITVPTPLKHISDCRQVKNNIITKVATKT